jgi:hypothetical protein
MADKINECINFYVCLYSCMHACMHVCVCAFNAHFKTFGCIFAYIFLGSLVHINLKPTSEYVQKLFYHKYVQHILQEELAYGNFA